MKLTIFASWKLNLGPLVHEQLAVGGVHLLLEPVPPQQPGDSVSFNISSAPVPPASATPMGTKPAVPTKDNSSGNETESDSGSSDGESKGESMKKKASSSSHKGGSCITTVCGCAWALPLTSVWNQCRPKMHVQIGRPQGED